MGADTEGEIQIDRYSDEDHHLKQHRFRSIKCKSEGTYAPDNYIIVCLHDGTSASNYTHRQDDILVIRGDNRVGIGTASPETRLNVAGYVKYQGITATESASIGTDLTATGNIGAGSYSRLPLAATDNNGVVMIGGSTSGLNVSTGVIYVNKTSTVTPGSDALITSGGISTALQSLGTSISQTRVKVGDFDLNMARDMNAALVHYTWGNNMNN